MGQFPLKGLIIATPLSLMILMGRPLLHLLAVITLFGLLVVLVELIDLCKDKEAQQLPSSQKKSRGLFPRFLECFLPKFLFEKISKREKDSTPSDGDRKQPRFGTPQSVGTESPKCPRIYKNYRAISPRDTTLSGLPSRIGPPVYAFDTSPTRRYGQSPQSLASHGVKDTYCYTGKPTPLSEAWRGSFHGPYPIGFPQQNISDNSLKIHKPPAVATGSDKDFMSRVLRLEDYFSSISYPKDRSVEECPIPNNVTAAKCAKVCQGQPSSEHEGDQPKEEFVSCQNTSQSLVADPSPKSDLSHFVAIPNCYMRKRKKCFSGLT